MPTCGAVHALSFCGDKLVSGGAEPAVYLWTRSGKLAARVTTPQDSIYSFASRSLSIGGRATDPRILVAAGTSSDLPLFYRSGATFGFCLST
eukprot:CAMPEP_0179452262 /NCGR_PEP_ID=MMETSP0799-20121207/36155_1 /TAXON_ID=46947 /ORGANISM="Geminigera cryophila, Strain CCMP2564" /LENGTH=91 /DNA_ID=CAMNT_0021248023 /DNA_START=47 /DNA_END=322 /DNA_ORIENTATION=-